MPERIMAHLVAWYPHREGSLAAARALVEGGAAYLEVQFPFSDPTADGPAIQGACDRALAAGFRLEEGFRLVERIRTFSPVPVFIMSYAGPMFARGVRRYLEQAAAAGAAGIIAPDLPVDSPEGRELAAVAGRLGLHCVPVVSPNVGEERLELARRSAGAEGYLYATLRHGTTGAATQIGRENLGFLHRLCGLGPKTLAGFGVLSPEQVRVLAPLVHAVVVGSAFVREIAALEESEATVSSEAVHAAVLARMRELAG